MLLMGNMFVRHRDGVRCLDICVDCGQWNMDMDLENMNFLQMQEPVETHGWEMVIMGMVSVLDRDWVGL